MQKEEGKKKEEKKMWQWKKVKEEDRTKNKRKETDMIERENVIGIFHANQKMRF